MIKTKSQSFFLVSHFSSLWLSHSLNLLLKNDVHACLIFIPFKAILFHWKVFRVELMVSRERARLLRVHKFDKRRNSESSGSRAISWKYFYYNLFATPTLDSVASPSPLTYSLDVINGVCRNTIFIPKIERTCDAIIIIFRVSKTLFFNLKAPLYHFQLIYFSTFRFEEGNWGSLINLICSMSGCHGGRTYVRTCECKCTRWQRLHFTVRSSLS